MQVLFTIIFALAAIMFWLMTWSISNADNSDARATAVITALPAATFTVLAVLFTIITFLA